MLWQRLTPLYEAGEAKAIVRTLLEDCFGMSLADYLCGNVDALPQDQHDELERMMCRLEQGEPVQYVTGSAVFYGRKFHVERGVLIPRPETGELVRWVVETERKREKEKGKGEQRILDIGTGSGCIAISIAIELQDADVEAWDISEDALRIARANAEILNAKVRFVNCDILSPLGSLLHYGGAREWHALTSIVSNPPYICHAEREQMERNVLDYEPEMALFVPDDDPLLFYNAIADYAATALTEDGWLFFEINPLYASDIEVMLKHKGFCNVDVRTDEYGKKRMIGAQRQ